METQLTPLPDFRLPDYPNAPLHLNGAPLSIINTSTPNSSSSTNDDVVTPAIGLATLLYNWHPNALAAFLDLEAWFSMTWTLSTPSLRLEIGRIANQITFGSLDSSGDTWTLMLTYNIVLEGVDRGKWIPNPRESMKGERDLVDVGEIERLGREWVKEKVEGRKWETGKGVKHRFFVEYAAMDVWGDGIAMSPHWLYRSLDLSRCTTCLKPSSPDEGELKRCGRCGTATYCSDVCQKGDWKVHKDICSVGLEERGKAIKISEKGGLIGWDEERMYAQEEGEKSGNPNLPEGTLKRRKATDTA
jgi:hypothetical protein